MCSIIMLIHPICFSILATILNFLQPNILSQCLLVLLINPLLFSMIPYSRFAHYFVTMPTVLSPCLPCSFEWSWFFWLFFLALLLHMMLSSPPHEILPQVRSSWMPLQEFLNSEATFFSFQYVLTLLLFIVQSHGFVKFSLQLRYV